MAENADSVPLTPAQRKAVDAAMLDPLGRVEADTRVCRALVDKRLAHYEGPAFGSDPMHGLDSCYLDDNVRWPEEQNDEGDS